MIRRENNVRDEIARLRRLVDDDVESGRIDPYQLVLFYDFVIMVNGKVALRPARGVDSWLSLHQVGLGVLGTPLDRLGLSRRAEHVLELWGVEILGQLIQVPRQGLEGTKGCGERTVKEIEGMLAEKGLRLDTRIEGRMAEVISRPRTPTGLSLDNYYSY